jgi:hypothetical protein
LRAIDLLLLVAAAILFFMGFVVGSALPPNVSADVERGKVSVQNLRVTPTHEIIHETIGNAEIVYADTPGAQKYLKEYLKGSESEAEATPDLVCERLPRSGTICYSPN